MPTERLEKIRREVEERGALPTLPEVPMRVLRLIADVKFSMEHISRIVERDPSLAANIVKVSNSTYYGMRQKVASLKLALAILGLNEVINIVTSISIARMFPSCRRAGEFNRVKFRRHH